MTSNVRLISLSPPFYHSFMHGAQIRTSHTLTHIAHPHKHRCFVAERSGIRWRWKKKEREGFHSRTHSSVQTCDVKWKRGTDAECRFVSWAQMNASSVCLCRTRYKIIIACVSIEKRGQGIDAPEIHHMNGKPLFDHRLSLLFFALLLALVHASSPPMINHFDFDFISHPIASHADAMTSDTIFRVLRLEIRKPIFSIQILCLRHRVERFSIRFSILMAAIPFWMSFNFIKISFDL